MTEKRKPAYYLDDIQKAFSTSESLSVTGTALRHAAALGCGRGDIVEVIQTIEPTHFYKSMTSYQNHQIWQDVYHVPSKYGMLYVKFTEGGTVSDFLLLSFKEKGNG